MTEPEPTEERRERRFPRIAVLAVAVVFIGIAAMLVNLAWRSSKETRDDAKPKVGEGILAKVQPASDPFVTCTNCHKDLDKVFKAGKVPGLLYRHQVHFSKGVSDCAQCHPATTHEADKINKPTMARCFMCHGNSKTSIAPGACSTCHPPGFPNKPTSHSAPDWVHPANATSRAQHGQQAKAGSIECMTCHQPTFCSNCHGLPTMPHPADWKDTHPQTFFTGAGGASVCQQCHARAPDQQHDFCDTCHHPQGPPNVPWKQYHPNVVKSQGASTCFKCHQEQTCSHCHVQHQEDFSADQALLSSSTKTTTPSKSSTTTTGSSRSP